MWIWLRLVAMLRECSEEILSPHASGRIRSLSSCGFWHRGHVRFPSFYLFFQLVIGRILSRSFHQVGPPMLVSFEFLAMSLPVYVFDDDMFTPLFCCCEILPQGRSRCLHADRVVEFRCDSPISKTQDELSSSEILVPTAAPNFLVDD